MASFFGELPRQAEIEFLRVTLDDLEADPDRDRARADAWLAGDLELEHAQAAMLHRAYPAFYRHLAVARNQAWVPRIRALLDSGRRAFIVVGIGHLVGPASLIEQIEHAGLLARRTSGNA